MPALPSPPFFFFFQQCKEKKWLEGSQRALLQLEKKSWKLIFLHFKTCNESLAVELKHKSDEVLMRFRTGQPVPYTDDSPIEGINL